MQYTFDNLFQEADNRLSTYINQFKDRKIKAKEIFTINEISKSLASRLIRQYHYLGDTDFISKYSFGLWCCERLVGVATYGNPQGNVTMKGWFNLDNDDQSVLELTRLAMLPILNRTNATSYFLSHTIKQLKKYGVKAVISLADASRHVGSIYQVCNFGFYGVTNDKNDFYRYPDGKKNPRCAVKDARGVWLPRSKKYRYAYIMTNSLKCNYAKEKAPKKGEVILKICCGGGHKVYDRRFDEWFTCPICTGRLERIEQENANDNLSRNNPEES